jgi:hypothetical protein
MATKIVADSGFWFALFEPRDQYHRSATGLQEELIVHDLQSLERIWPRSFVETTERTLGNHRFTVFFGC